MPNKQPLKPRELAAIFALVSIVGVETDTWVHQVGFLELYNSWAGAFHVKQAEDRGVRGSLFSLLRSGDVVEFSVPAPRRKPFLRLSKAIRDQIARSSTEDVLAERIT